MEAVMACWEIEQSLQSLTGTTILFLLCYISQHKNKGNNFILVPSIIFSLSMNQPLIYSHNKHNI